MILLSSIFLKIGDISFSLSELKRDRNQFAIIREINKLPGEEIEIGTSSNFFRIVAVSKKISYKYSFNLILDKQKYLLIRNIFENQKQQKIFNFNEKNNSFYDITEFFHCSLNNYNSVCIIDDIEILKTGVDNSLKYEIKIDITEI